LPIFKVKKYPFAKRNADLYDAENELNKTLNKTFNGMYPFCYGQIKLTKTCPPCGNSTFKTSKK
jgi:hypothetical protein